MISIVGMKYCGDLRAILDALNLNDRVQLVKEPDNKYDKNAMACYHKDIKIGYVSRDYNKSTGEGDYRIQWISGTVIGIIEYCPHDSDLTNILKEKCLECKYLNSCDYVGRSEQ
jgi:hypothetical protein